MGPVELLGADGLPEQDRWEVNANLENGQLERE